MPSNEPRGEPRIQARFTLHPEKGPNNPPVYEGPVGRAEIVPARCVILPGAEAGNLGGTTAVQTAPIEPTDRPTAG